MCCPRCFPLIRRSPKRCPWQDGSWQSHSAKFYFIESIMNTQWAWHHMAPRGTVWHCWNMDLTATLFSPWNLSSGECLISSSPGANWLNKVLSANNFMILLMKRTNCHHQCGLYCHHERLNICAPLIKKNFIQSFRWLFCTGFLFYLGLFVKNPLETL